MSASTSSTSPPASMPQTKPRVSKARLRANRANAKKSTGPRTQEGKKRSAQNAISHGLFCQNLILPGERMRDFLLLRLGFHCDLRATDSIEFAIVERAVIAQWRMRRCQSAEARLHRTSPVRATQREMQVLFGKTPTLDALLEQPATMPPRDTGALNRPADTTLAMDFEDPASPLERLSRYEHRLEHHFYKALRELRAYRKGKQKDQEDERYPDIERYPSLERMRQELRECEEEEIEEVEDLDDEREASEDERDERDDREEHDDREEDGNKGERVIRNESSSAAAQNEPNAIASIAGDDADKRCERGSGQESVQALLPRETVDADA